MEEPRSEEVRDWIRRRVAAVKDVYGAYDCLIENGIDLIDEHTALQIICPFHSDRSPSARYYAITSDGGSHFHCFTCKLHLDSVNLYAKFHSIKFMQALADLERRFRIDVPRKPESPEIPDEERDVTEGWRDVPRMLLLLEKKLLRIRDQTPRVDYVRFCRILDAVKWDLDRRDGQTPQMVDALDRVRDMMDDVGDLP